MASETEKTSALSLYVKKKGFVFQALCAAVSAELDEQGSARAVREAVAARTLGAPAR